MTELMFELHGLEWDVVLFSETRFSGASCILMDSHLLFASDLPTPCAGVSILLHQRHKHGVKYTKYVSDRLMYIDLLTNRGLIRIVAAYAPHAGYPFEDLQAFYHQLQEILEEGRRKRCSVIIGGNFNTQWESGRRGELLSEMCDAFKLRLANEEDDWTFCSCMGVKRRIDFVLCSSGLQLLDSRASYAIDLGSDHRSVVASFDLQQRRWNKTAKKKSSWLEACIQQKRGAARISRSTKGANAGETCANIARFGRPHVESSGSLGKEVRR